MTLLACEMSATVWYFEHSLDFPGGSDGKASAYNVRDLGSVPGLRGSPGEGNGNPSSILAWRSLVGYSPWGRKD